jgi:two-component system cell cycle response regulator DivK
MPKADHLVLVVDDIADNREMYAEYLQFLGYRVISAASGHDALVRAVTHRPTIIVMDLMMPGLDGWQTTRVLKSDAATAHIPVIALTGHAFMGSAREALRAGCVRCLIKPCLPEDLARAIDDLIVDAA